MGPSRPFIHLTSHVPVASVPLVIETPRAASQAVGFVLGFIGVKMILDFGGVHIDTGVSLGVVATSLGLGVGLSLAGGKSKEEVK